MENLSGKVAVITGAAAGIGFAAASLFLDSGAAVVICDVNEKRLLEAVKALASKGEVCGFTIDIANKEMCDSTIKNVMERYGHVDVLINNAGITMDAQFYKMTDEQFERVIAVNLMGNYHMTKAVVTHMINQRRGKIIHTASVSAYNGNFGQANYAASKAGIIGMTRVQAKELGKYGINVNAVSPGSIMTEMYNAVPEEVKEKKLKSIPLRRYGNPSDVADLFAFLASDKSDYITGQNITIDGGYN